MDEMTVASVMTTRVVTVRPETPLRELVAKMADVQIRAVPVVNRYGQPIGVVSAADLVPEQGFLRDRDDRPPGRADRARWSRPRAGNATEVMTPLRAIHADEPVSFAAQLLAKPGIRRLFVINWDSQLVGVVVRRDLRRAATNTPGVADVRFGLRMATVGGGVSVRQGR